MVITYVLLGGGQGVSHVCLCLYNYLSYVWTDKGIIVSLIIFNFTIMGFPKISIYILK